MSRKDSNPVLVPVGPCEDRCEETLTPIKSSMLFSQDIYLVQEPFVVIKKYRVSSKPWDLYERFQQLHKKQNQDDDTKVRITPADSGGTLKSVGQDELVFNY